MSAGGMFDPSDDGEINDEATSVERGFLIADEAQASFAVESIMVARHRLALRCASVENMERELAGIEAWYTPLLEDYYRANPPKPGTKTLKLSTGSLSSRLTRGGMRVKDEAACVAWAHEHFPEALTYTVVAKLDFERMKREAERIYGEALARAFASVEATDPDHAFGLANAEAKRALPPGVALVDDRESFSVNPPKGV